MIVKRPPAKMFPLPSIVSAWTSPFALGSQPVSRLPSVLRRAMLLRGVPFTCVNLPPTITLPSACTATASTKALSRTCVFAGLVMSCA
jgi:hypothetical protein